MDEIKVTDVKTKVKAALKELGTGIDPKGEAAIRKAVEVETSELAIDVLNTLLKNYELARQESLPVCQDTGTVVVYVEIGIERCWQGMEINNAINEAVREVWQEECFRASILQDPLFDRSNTRDNTPAVIHTEITSGDGLRIILALKGGGAENMSALKMLQPADGVDGIRAFVLETVIKAGGNACPPLIVGVGIGGNFELCPYLAKRALFRELGTPHPVPEWAELEAELLQAINETGIGPQGLGGRTTALAVHIETKSCHLASLPVAVNLNCHAHRHCEIIF
jgi:fumarate hydratase subunit alpha